MTSDRPRLLDLFSGAGGAAMGYYRAGFEVIGVDIKPQPNYPFTFYQADALRWLADNGSYRFDAIHASPPCQAYSALRNLNGRREYPDLIEETRALLKKMNVPYVIENVMGAPLLDPIMLCGTMFALRTECGAELRRHRLFETNWSAGLIPNCQHGHKSIGVYGTGNAMAGARVISVCGHGTPGALSTPRTRTITVTGQVAQQNVVRNKIRETFSNKQARIAMGIDWMNRNELSQAIPPAYTEFIGTRLMEYLHDR